MIKIITIPTILFLVSACDIDSITVEDEYLSIEEFKRECEDKNGEIKFSNFGERLDLENMYCLRKTGESND